MYVEVLVELPARQVDRAFYYLVPAQLKDRIMVGSRVQVPFRQQKLCGYVIGFSLPSRLGQIKEISAVLDEGPVFNPAQMALARWLAAYYLCPTVSALQSIIGPRLVGAPRRVQGLWPADTQNLPVFSRAPAQEKAWRVALAQPGLTRQEVAVTAGVSTRAVDALIAKRLLYVGEYLKSRRSFFIKKNPGRSLSPLLTLHQEQAASEITTAIQEGKYRAFLLYGVTGSGKTEVYCQSISQVLSLGRTAIVLVPEIALTEQMITTFQSRFGERVAILHSRLADGERYAEWMRIGQGGAGIVLGARSALFAPLDNPGLFILDEEHEPSYKQEETPRYHTRTVALHMARERGAVIVLGSATPSLESFYAANQGSCRLLRMDERIEGRPLPRVHIVDMREELRKGNPGLFSRVLLLAMQRTLVRGEQIILFLNRRGFSTIVVCRECGLVIKCPHCNVSLTYHKNGRLLCHYCHFTMLAPAFCPDCRSVQIGYFGTGTQKIEQEIKRLFPTARVLRLDSDTTTRKGSYREILGDFRQGEADILIGTQMVAKGLDIPSVTLVGVVNADISLHMPDFRASERTFQLLTQVAGRAGRSDLGGEALIQTYQPEHYAIQAARNHDYEGFYQKEIEYRRCLSYPPFSHLGRFLFAGAQNEEAEGAINILYRKLKEFAGQEEIQFMGPAPAPLSRIKDYYRWHLVLKAPCRDLLRAVAAAGLNECAHFTSRRLRVNVDLEPQSLM